MAEVEINQVQKPHDADPWDRKLILPAGQNEVDPPYTVFTSL